MILQRDTRLPENIRTDGCYFMSLLWWANKLANVPLDTSRIQDVIYPHCLSHKWLNRELYIFDPDAILAYLGVDARYHGQHDAPTRVCGDNEFEILLFHYSPKDWYHFTAGDGLGNVTYDPWGVSITATRGSLKSKRIFTLVDTREGE